MFDAIDAAVVPAPLAPIPGDVADLLALYERVVGLPHPPLPTAAGGVLDLDRLPEQSIVALARIRAGREDQAIDALMLSLAFNRSRLMRFTSALTNEDKRLFESIDDSQYLIAAAYHQNIDFRRLFTEPTLVGDGFYSYDNFLGRTFDGVDLFPEVFDRPSRVRIQVGVPLASRGSDRGQLLSILQSPVGLLSSHGFARRFIEGGTNRRPVRAVFDIFMCAPMESWRSTARSDFWVARDIDRSPGRDPNSGQSQYLTGCSGCHSGLDSIRGAWAHMDFRNRERVISRTVVPKYNQGGHVYPEGYVTLNNEWENLFTTPDEAQFFGWEGPAQGAGLESLGRMIVGSRRFRECMAIRAIEALCPRSDASRLDGQRSPEIAHIASAFQSSGFKLKTLFKQTLMSPACE